MFSFYCEKGQNSTMHAAIDILCFRHKQPLALLIHTVYVIVDFEYQNKTTSDESTHKDKTSGRSLFRPRV